MKKFISRKHIAFVLLFLIPVKVFAQEFDLGSKIQKVWDGIITYWPVAMAIVL